MCFWTWKEFTLEGYTGKASKKDVGHYSGSFTATVFLPGTGNCLTSTSDGYVIVWAAETATGVSRDEVSVRVAAKVFAMLFRACIDSNCMIFRSSD